MLFFLLSLFLCLSSCQPAPDTADQEGVRRALLVGVARYRNAEANLKGPTYDVANMADLLTRAYGFTDVRELLNEKATPDAFRAAMAELAADSRPEDTVLVYFSGHGRQITDNDGNEGDGMDETLVFYEPGEGMPGDIVDDEFNGMLRKIYGRTKKLVIILDSCHSGTGYRTVGMGNARLWPHDDGEAEPLTATRGDGNPFEPGSMPEAIKLCASRDGSLAIDLHRNGAFTKALIEVLSTPGARNLTWLKVAHRLERRLRLHAPGQRPSFDGPLWRPVFGGPGAEPPLFWITDDPESGTVTLRGQPMTGMGPGSIMLVHDQNTVVSDFGDPSKATAKIVIRDYNGFNARAEIVEGEVEGGEAAVLHRPVSVLEPMGIRIRRAPAPGGLTVAQARFLEARIADPRCRGMALDDENGVLEFHVDDGRLVLGDDANPVYTSFPHGWLERGETIVASLQQLALRRELLALQPRGPLSRKDLLTVSLEPNPKHSSCSRGRLIKAEPGRIQNIPLCHAWNVRVAVSRNAPREGVRVGGLLLSADGSILGFPFENGRVVLPGQSTVFEEDTETFIAGPPVGVLDTLLIFATEPDHAVPWGRFKTAKATHHRGIHALSLPAQRDALGKLAGTNTRAAGGADNWHMVSVTLRVQAHPGFPDEPGLTAAERFLLAECDIRPYLPGDRSFRHRLLDEADRLVGHSLDAESKTWPRVPLSRERVGELGADAARAMAYLFSLADRDWEIAETGLVDRLRGGDCDELVAVPEKEAQMGDLLVYGDASGFHHLVLVIDPAEDLAVGAFPWMDSPRFGYQKILSRRDWADLGYPTARVIGCYRHVKLSDQAPDHRGVVALERLQGICNPNRRCAP